MNEAVTAGCTAVVALLQRGNLIVANAGDSRCVLSSRGVVRNDLLPSLHSLPQPLSIPLPPCPLSQAIEMSRDHKPELPEERARIEKARGFVEFGRVNGSLALSRALGDLEYKRNYQLEPSEQMVTALPEIRLRKLEEGDEFVVLACDGIWSAFPFLEPERLQVSGSLSCVVSPPQGCDVLSGSCGLCEGEAEERPPVQVVSHSGGAL